MTDKQTDTVVDRFNSLAVESTQTLVDAAYLAQRQSAQLLQAWLNTLDASQKSQREIATTLVKQAQEAQRLLQQYVRDSLQSNVETFTKTTQAQFKQAANNFNTVTEQVNAAGKRTEGK
jgi:hypothetical protein